MNRSLLMVRNFGILGIGVLCGMFFRVQFFEHITIQATGETMVEELVAVATTTGSEVATTTEATILDQAITELSPIVSTTTEPVLSLKEEVPPLDQQNGERLPSPAPQVNPELLILGLNSITCHSEPLLSQYDNPGDCMRAAQF